MVFDAKTVSMLVKETWRTLYLSLIHIFCRIRIFLPARYGKIFDTGGWMPRMKKLLRRQKRHRRIPLSCVCRMGMTRCWRATVQI